MYYAVTFLDEEMLIPTMEPVVFVGRNLDREDVDRFYFQDADSYREGIRYSTGVAEDDATFYSGAAPNHIFDYERARLFVGLCTAP